jgi:RNA polymerase sigma-70 factor (ECF subfamily)
MTKAMLHPDTALPFEAEAQAPAARTLEESALIRSAQRGDRDAFDELVHRYDQDVLRLALQITRRPEDAHDIYQEAFLKVYRNLDRFRFECNFYTWLYRVVTNVCLDHLRRRSSRPEDQAPESPNAATPGDEDFFDRQAHPAPHSNPERALMGKELGQRISLAMERLPARARGFRIETLPGPAPPCDRRDARHYGRNCQELAVSRDSQAAHKSRGVPLMDTPDNPPLVPCVEFERRLTLYVWQELEPADIAAVEGHIASCSTCAAALARERTLLEQLGSLDSEQPSDLLVAQCRRSLSRSLDRAEAAARWWKQVKAAFRPATWLAARPAWTVAALVLIGFFAGRFASRTTSLPASSSEPAAATEAVTPASFDNPSIVGIQRLPGGGVAVRMRSDQPVVVQGNLNDGDIRRALLAALQASDSPDPDARLESVELLRADRTDAAVRRALCQAMLHDTNPSVRLKAIDALRGLEQEAEVRHALLRALEHDGNPGVRVEAISALRAYLDSAPSDELTRDGTFVRVLRDRQRKDPNEFVRLQSDAAIRQISARDVQ